MRRSVPFLTAVLAVLVGTLPVWFPYSAEADPAESSGEAKQAAEADDSSSEETIDPLGPNAACYVCHMTFVHEELSKVHKAAKVGCTDCHGVSAKHANDEDIGATKPDKVYKRDQVDPACKKCHESHDVPAKKVVARFLQRKLSAENPPICTDCHGQHRIDRAAEEKAK
jgi:hypothetical protein